MGPVQKWKDVKVPVKENMTQFTWKHQRILGQSCSVADMYRKRRFCKNRVTAYRFYLRPKTRKLKKKFQEKLAMVKENLSIFEKKVQTKSFELKTKIETRISLLDVEITMLQNRQ